MDERSLGYIMAKLYVNSYIFLVYTSEDMIIIEGISP